MNTPLQQIPTNIITGFLGVGKSTAITQLLRNKANSERWAVLVNEFGKVGIDGALLSGTTSDSPSIFIREVPGGCLCCAASVPMQVALNQLLKEARPDRLLIEPTGLGHPKQIIAALSKPEYHSVLDLRSTITLVDARKIADSRYTNHPTFNQQLEVADLIVANKSDLYSDHELDTLRHYLKRAGLGSTPLHAVSEGAVESSWLNQQPHTSPPVICGETPPIDQFHSHGWTFDSDTCFNFKSVNSLFSQLQVIRLKAVIRTDRGLFGFNWMDENLQCIKLTQLELSRVEVIDTQPASWEGLEDQLIQCQISG